MPFLLIALCVVIGVVGLALVVVWPRADSRNSPKWLLCLVVIWGLAYLAIFNTNAEDAYITYRYSANMAAGQGPVFNAGERVEGYSNFLLMAMLAGCRAVGLDIVWGARGICLVASLLSLLVVARIGTQLTGRTGDGPLAALLLAASAPFAAYAFSGMETPLFVLWILLAVQSATNNRWGAAGIWSGLATMTRPDGVVIAAALLLWICLAAEERRGRIGMAVRFCAANAVLILPWTIWRLVYYGHLLPNCLQAKRGMEFTYQLKLGLRYAAEFGWHHLPLLAAVVLLLVAKLTGKRRAVSGTLVGLLMMGLCYLGFVIFIGGDWMPALRMAVPLVPLLALLFVVLLKDVLAGFALGSGRGAAVLVVAMSVMMMVMAIPIVGDVHDWNEQVADGTTIGKWWRRSLPTDTLMASYAVGALSYYSQLPTIDMLGLTDEHIARQGRRQPRGLPGHIAFDYRYVAGRHPDILFFSGTPFHQLPTAPQIPTVFRSEYELVVFQFKNSSSSYGQFVKLFIRKDRRDELVQMLLDVELGIVDVPQQTPEVPAT